MKPNGFAEVSLHQGKIDDASLLECHRCIRACVGVLNCVNLTVFVMNTHYLLSSLKFVAFINCSNFKILGCL